MKAAAIQTIYNKGIESIPKHDTGVGNMLKNAAPYIIAGTLLKGLQQQVYLAASETILSYTAAALTGGYVIAGALGAFAMYKVLDPHFIHLGYKKIEKVTISKEDFQVLKNEIDRLFRENETLKMQENA